jgi:drug/metabolite transporter (DMT)-like permease
MIEAVINALVAGLIGTIAFVVIKEVVDAQDTSTWSAAESALVDIIPLVLAILVVVGMFMGLTRMRSGR